MTDRYITHQLADDPATYGPDAGKFIVTSHDRELEFSGPMSQSDAAAYAAVLSALDYLLEQTVDQDLKYGIGLSEGEEDARKKALAALELATGRMAV
jgi:hypothetical protein